MKVNFQINKEIDKNNTNVNLNIISNEVNILLQDLEEYSSKTNNVESIFSSDENDIFSNEIKLFYENSNENDMFKSLISEKLPKSNFNILPECDYKNTVVNNIFEIDMNNFEKNFEKFFPSVVRLSEKSDIVIYEEVKKKDSKFTSTNQIENLMKLTSNYKISIVQKYVYLWGLSRYGLNLSILYDLPNIFPFSKSIYFDKEEDLMNYLTEMMKEYDVDLEGSSFENLTTIKDSYLFNIKGDPPLLNSTECNFEYNSKLYNYLVKRENQINFPLFIMKKPSLPIKNYNEHSIHSQIGFLIENRFFKNQKEREKSKFHIKSVKNNLRTHLLEVSNFISSNYKIFCHKDKDLKISFKVRINFI